MGTSAQPAAATPAAQSEPALGAPLGSNAREHTDEYTQQLVSRYGSAQNALRVLGDENFTYRERHRKDREVIDDLTKRVAPKDAVVLTAEEAKEWEVFKTLGKAADVKKKSEEHVTLTQEVATAKRQALHREASEAVGYKPTVLSDLLDTKKLALEMRDVQVADPEDETKKKTVKLPYVKPADSKDAPFELLTDFAERNLKDYLPALQAESAEDDSAQGGSSGGSAKGPTVKVPTQVPAGGKAPKADVVGKTLGARRQLPSQRNQTATNK